MGPDGPDPVRRVLTFTSDPLEEDLECVGPVLLELFASSTNVDTDFIVKLAEQRPQSDEERAKGINPPFTNVSKGWLKASHHTTKNEALSTPMRPFYDHDHPRPLTPGDIYRFEVEILPIGHRFKAGNRIRVEIVNGDSSATDRGWTHPYHPSKVGTDTFEHNAKFPSRLVLPVIRTGSQGWRG